MKKKASDVSTCVCAPNPKQKDKQIKIKILEDYLTIAGGD